MRDRVAIVDGVRTPFCKSGGALAEVEADDLGAVVVRELLARNDIQPEMVDEVIFGNVAQPTRAANVARVIAQKAGLPRSVIAQTVHRNCASGMQSMTTAAKQILTGESEIIIAGGTESMSRIPLLFGEKMTKLFVRLMKSRTFMQRLRTLTSFRPSFLSPVIALQQGLTDPICELNMAETAEILARRFHITRAEQDAYAKQSHDRAIAARVAGRLSDEIAPLVAPPRYEKAHLQDDGPRENQSMEALAKLQPYCNKQSGTVTAGNSCPITDGAVAVLMMSERRARSLGVEPLGYLSAWAYAALDGREMGLGPVHAVARLEEKTGRRVESFDLIELNEAFAAQVLANVRAFESAQFAREELNRKHAVGSIDPQKLNVNGGAIALGHPVGATGTRLVLTLLHELKRRGKQQGLATLCVGGGQGAALALEAA